MAGGKSTKGTPPTKNTMKEGGFGRKYPVDQGPAQGRMQAPGASDSKAISALKRAAGSPNPDKKR